MRPDVLVIGGGPAGAAAAIWLARGGARVTLAERAPGPREVACGDFLGPAARRHLADLGIPTDDALFRVRLWRGGKRAEARLPFAAAAVPRRDLDARLLDLAADAGVRVRRGVAAVALDTAPLRVRLANGEVCAPGAVVLATGKHDLRGAPPRRGPLEGYVGLKAAVPDPGLAADAVELLLFEGGYLGCLVAGGRATFSAALSAAALRRCGGSWRGLLAALAEVSPPWRARLEMAAAARPAAVAGLPYGFVAEAARDGVFPVGDRAAVVPSLMGEGVGIALASGRMAAEALLAGRSAADYGRAAAAAFGWVRPLAWAARGLSGGPVQALAMAAAARAPGLVTAAARWRLDPRG